MPSKQAIVFLLSLLILSFTLPSVHAQSLAFTVALESSSPGEQAVLEDSTLLDSDAPTLATEGDYTALLHSASPFPEFPDLGPVLSQQAFTFTREIFPEVFSDEGITSERITIDRPTEMLFFPFDQQLDRLQILGPSGQSIGSFSVSSLSPCNENTVCDNFESAVSCPSDCGSCLEADLGDDLEYLPDTCLELSAEGAVSKVFHDQTLSVQQWRQRAYEDALREQVSAQAETIITSSSPSNSITGLLTAATKKYPLEITTIPGASISVDNVPSGTADNAGKIVIYLAAGTYKISITKTSFAPSPDLSVAISTSAINTLTHPLASLSSATITITSKPSSAAIYLDGISTSKKTTSSLANVPAGKHTVEVRRSGHFDMKTTLTVAAGETYGTPFALTACPAGKTGTLKVTSVPSGAAVFLNAETTPRGQTPLTISVPACSHTLKVEKTGYASATKRISISAGKTLSQPFTLAPLPSPSPTPSPSPSPSPSPTPSPPACGNNKCDADETVLSCLSDCPDISEYTRTHIITYSCSQNKCQPVIRDCEDGQTAAGGKCVPSTGSDPLTGKIAAKETNPLLSFFNWLFSLLSPAGLFTSPATDCSTLPALQDRIDCYQKQCLTVPSLSQCAAIEAPSARDIALTVYASSLLSTDAPTACNSITDSATKEYCTRAVSVFANPVITPALTDDQRTQSGETFGPSATLSISSTPAGASVFLNAESTPRGQAPLTLQLPAGTYTVRAEKPGYLTPPTQTVIIQSSPVSLAFTLQPEPGTLLVTSNQKDSIVKQGSTTLGKTSVKSGSRWKLKASLQPGTYTITVEKSGFKKQSFPGTIIKSGKTKTLTVTLKK